MNSLGSGGVDYVINIKIIKKSNVNIYLNNGTTIKTASNQVEVDDFITGYEFNYTASATNIIYLIVVGSAEKPVA